MEKQQKHGALLPGIILIAVGIGFLLSQLNIVRSENIWPIFILAPGLGFLAMYFYSNDKPKDAGLLIPGFITTLLALFFFYLNIAGWEQMKFLWPLFPLIVGIAFFGLYFASPHEKSTRAILVPATILSLVGIFFLIFARFSYNYWPILLIAFGLFLIFANRNNSEKNKKHEPKDDA